MQGGTVEHATVVASTRDLTKGWSYTALSRARHNPLHIDAARLPAGALEREEHALTARITPPDRAEVPDGGPYAVEFVRGPSSRVLAEALPPRRPGSAAARR